MPQKGQGARVRRGRLIARPPLRGWAPHARGPTGLWPASDHRSAAPCRAPRPRRPDSHSCARAPRAGRAGARRVRRGQRAAVVAQAAVAGSGVLAASSCCAGSVAWGHQRASPDSFREAPGFSHGDAYVSPSRFAFSRIANSFTDVWLIPSFRASATRRRLASGLRRILVMCFFSMPDSITQMRYKCMGTCQRSHHCRSSASSVSRSGPAKHRECPSASVRVRWSMIAS